MEPVCMNNQKLRALYDTRNHWQWLMITGDTDKESYEPADVWVHECGCCEYISVVDEDHIPGYAGGIAECGPVCPLTGFAWGEYGCYDNLSPYRAWERLSNKVYAYDYEEENREYYLKFYAKRMVEACNRAIESELLREIS